jgi:hypothetical protein
VRRFLTNLIPQRYRLLGAGERQIATMRQHCCGKAVEVPGLRDPLWRVLQGTAAVGWAAATAAAWFAWGVAGAAATAVCVAALLWLVSRAL